MIRLGKESYIVDENILEHSLNFKLFEYLAWKIGEWKIGELKEIGRNVYSL